MPEAIAPPWPFDEWGRITWFLESGRLAFAREHELWGSLEFGRPDEITISAPKPQGVYRLRLEQHLASVRDQETFHAAVLIQTYALAEYAATDRLGLDARSVGGIEDWGTRLLTAAGANWTVVRGGIAGAVETAVVRNAYAHGSRVLSRGAAGRLTAVGIDTRPAGSRVSLSYDDLVDLRSRLRGLLGAGGLGAPR